MAERLIEQADLQNIEDNLGAIYNGLDALTTGVSNVNSNVKIVYNEVGNLAKEFREFIDIQQRANRTSLAETRLVKIRQELEKKYGHYDLVRRTTTGILQADDLGIVKKDTINTATEELMISTPGYWLAPCLVALAAWINNKPDLAGKALREAIRRDDEKTSLFFALVCRRAERKEACLKWTQRYLANQDEEMLDRKAIIVLDAYASGLLGADTEGVISRQIDQWLMHLEEKPGFVEQQTQQWSDAINLKRKQIDDTSYSYLRKYSNTWPVLEDIMEGACLHETMLDYLTGIFDKDVQTGPLKEQLDDILNSLVSDFDDEELPLRKEEQFEQFVIDFNGDEKRAKSNMQIQQTAFETHKDFTQLLTDAAMTPESSGASVSTQKFAFALSHQWVLNAYNDVVAKNRMKIPDVIEINVDTFNGDTTDGHNEAELIDKFNKLVDSERDTALEDYKLSAFESFCFIGGILIAIVGLFMAGTGNKLLGLISLIAGIGMIIKYYSANKKLNSAKKQIIEQFEKKRDDGSQIIRATLADVVDFRMEFAEKDSESEKVIDFLEQVRPDQYVRKRADSGRKIRI